MNSVTALFGIFLQTPHLTRLRLPVEHVISGCDISDIELISIPCLYHGFIMALISDKNVTYHMVVSINVTIHIPQEMATIRDNNPELQ